ncbi:MAG: hypothetical protein ACE5FJ_08065 [Gemmatimonadales bacterium]
MGLFEILSPLAMLIGGFLLLRFTQDILLGCVAWWRLVPLPDTHLVGAQNNLETEAPADEPDRDGDGTAAFIYQGEPWFSPANLWAFGLQSAAVGLVLLAYLWRGEELLIGVSRWVDAHPFWAGTVGVACLVVALVIGAVRQMFIRLMSLACALPVEDDTGRRFFAYIGDVPPLIWQYSGWFRAGTWCVVTATSLVFAFLGAELVSMLIGERFDIVFIILLFLRWAASSVPTRLWVE